MTAIATVAAALGAPPASAQSLYGALVGTVADQSGAPVPGAAVTAMNTGTGLELQTTSGTDGTFAFRNLQPGVYDVRSVLQGFKEIRKTGVRVVAGNPRRIDLDLEVGTVAEAVTVAADSALQTEKADLHTEITSTEVVTLPLNQFRNFQVLFNLVPGTTPAQFQNVEIDTPGRALTPSINGTARNNNAFRIDGAVSVNVWLPHHVGYVQPAETIEMVSVSTNNFDADQGMAGGAVITVLTKSGTNVVRGSAFVFRNQDELNANTFSNNAFGLEKAPQVTSIYGGTLGGPIIKNRLFFFGWASTRAAWVIHASTLRDSDTPGRLSPGLVLEGNFGINRQDQTVAGPDYGQNIGLDVFGIPGTNGHTVRQSGLPAFDMPTSPWSDRTPMYDLGTENPFMPLSRDERSYTAGSALTWVRGPHQLRAGIDVVRHELNHFAADSSFAGLRGGFQFGGLVTGTPGHGARLEQHTCANAPIGLSTAVY